jgi:hypothetical protein
MISDFEPCDPENWKEISLSNPSSFITSIDELKPYAMSSDIYYIRAKKSNKTRAFYQASKDSTIVNNITNPTKKFSITPESVKLNGINLNDITVDLSSLTEVKPHNELTSVTRGCSKITMEEINTIELLNKPKNDEFINISQELSTNFIDDLISQLGVVINQSVIDDEIKATKLRLKVLKLFKRYHV